MSRVPHTAKRSPHLLTDLRCNENGPCIVHGPPPQRRRVRCAPPCRTTKPLSSSATRLSAASRGKACTVRGPPPQQHHYTFKPPRALPTANPGTHMYPACAPPPCHHTVNSTRAPLSAMCPPNRSVVVSSTRISRPALHTGGTHRRGSTRGCNRSAPVYLRQSHVRPEKHLLTRKLRTESLPCRRYESTRG